MFRSNRPTHGLCFKETLTVCFVWPAGELGTNAFDHEQQFAPMKLICIIFLFAFFDCFDLQGRTFSFAVRLFRSLPFHRPFVLSLRLPIRRRTTLHHPFDCHLLPFPFVCLPNAPVSSCSNCSLSAFAIHLIAFFRRSPIERPKHGEKERFECRTIVTFTSASVQPCHVPWPRSHLCSAGTSISTFCRGLQMAPFAFGHYRTI